jgi:quercetin dioxygenase-like cupin family protein
MVIRYRAPVIIPARWRKGLHVQFQEASMASLTRRELAVLAASAAVTARANSTRAQIRSGPGVKYTEILAKDLEGFSLQMTRLTLMDVAPETQIPRHYHPAAQEIAFGIDGTFTLDIHPHGAKIIQAGDVALIPAGITHLPRAHRSKHARVLFIHSITDKTKPFLVELDGSDGPE